MVLLPGLKHELRGEKVKTLNELLKTLSVENVRDNEVFFSVDERLIRPGYHITEVRVGTFSSVDCGGGIENWNEVQVQLLDGSSYSADDATYMSADKLGAILNRSSVELKPPVNARLVFELTTQTGVLGKWQIERVQHEDQRINLQLVPMQAQCKPASRLQANLPDVIGCCEPSVVANSCCQSDQMSSQTRCCA